MSNKGHGLCLVLKTEFRWCRLRIYVQSVTHCPDYLFWSCEAPTGRGTPACFFILLLECSYILCCSLEQTIVGPIIHSALLWCSGHSGWCQGEGYSGHLWGPGHSAGNNRGHLPGLPYIQLVFFPVYVLVVPNEATLSGVEPASAVLADLGASAPESKESVTSKCDGPKPAQGLVLGGGLPTIPAEILSRIHKNSYMELSKLLPEKIQESFLYPDGRKKKVAIIDKFVDWVLAFCTYGQALLARKPDIGGDLLTFVGTVARLARDHPGPAWAAYEQMFCARAVADPSTEWNKLDQEVCALSAVKASGPSTQLPQRRRVDRSCMKWNEGTFCPFKACKFNHTCSHCGSPQHRAMACPSKPTASKKN